MKKKITLDGLIKFIRDVDVVYFDLSKRAVYNRIYNPKMISLDDYFPCEVERKLGILERRGMIVISKTQEGTKVELTESGKKTVLKFDLDNLSQIVGLWDGKWRLVFFDVEEKDRKKRRDLVFYLEKLGLKKMQESVYIGPFDCEKEIKFIREVLGIPHGVKLATLEKIENEDELKQWFDL